MADALRIDKWLFFTRFFKTRGQASAAVTGGHVTRAGERAKPAQPVRVGDALAITRGRYTWHVEVVEIPKRRGPAKEAQACYVESEASREARESLSQALRSDRLGMPRTDGRPDKHTRRRLREWKDSHDA
ncbi:MAG: RNA-binding S4 domain-containing protein [Pseudomonadota bacterium]